VKHKIAVLILLTIIVCTLLFVEDKLLLWVIIGSVLLVFTLVLIVGVTTPKFNYFMPSINRAGKGKICLTFDDGPHENTLDILDILKKHQVKASFFVIGKNCQTHDLILHELAKDGHIIGNHSFSHTNKLGWASTKKIRQEIKDTNAIVEKICGVKIKYYRPPFGISNPNIARAVTLEKMQSVGWSIRSFDTVSKTPEKLINKLTRRVNKKGHILLFHDSCDHTVKILDELIVFCKDRGMEFVNLDDNRFNKND